jgi:hypothetical protein
LSKPRISNEVRDLLLYVVIGVALVTGVIWLAEYDADHHINKDIQWRYLGAGIFTCFVFGFLISNNREMWRSPRVWMLWVVFLGAHLAGWSRYMIGQVTGVPIGLYAIVAIAEITVFSTLTTFVFLRFSGKP